jgi:Ca2+-binding RTX toxin-like protein
MDFGFDFPGTPGADSLTGTSAPDHFNGYAGNDTLSGGGGNDTYQFNWGYGVDTILDTATPGAGNVLQFGSGIILDSIILGHTTDTLIIQVGWDGDMVLLPGFDPTNAYGAHAIDTFQFDDGSSMSYAQLMDFAFDNIGTTGDDTLVGTSASDLFNGQTGNDTQSGGAGNDQYVYGWGDGQDTIIETDSTPGNADRLIFYDVIDPMHLVLSQQANDLRLAVYGDTGAVTIQDWFLGADHQVEDIQAASGQYHLANTQVTQLIQAMASFSQQTGLTWEQGLAQQPQQVHSILAANWQGM